MQFDLEETMRKHDQTLQHYRERVKQDQRDADVLTGAASGVPSGAGLGLGGGAGLESAYAQQSYSHSQPPPAAPPAQPQHHHHQHHAPSTSPQHGGGGGGGGGGSSYAQRDVGLEMLGFGNLDAAYPQGMQSMQGMGGGGASGPSGPVTPGRMQRPSRGTVGGSSTPGMRRGQPAEDATPGMKLASTNKTAHPLRVYDRVTQWQRRKQQKLDEQRRMVENKEVEGCPFAPTTRSQPMAQPAPKMGSIYGGNGRAWGYDEFVERQREARRRNEEKVESTKFSGKNWKNKPTVPQEFQLGRRDKSIKALQKPLSPPSFVPSVSEHHHLAKEATALAADSPFAQLAGQGLVQRGLFSERISTAIIDNTMLHPKDEEDEFQYVRRTACLPLFPCTSRTPTHTFSLAPQAGWLRRPSKPKLHAWVVAARRE